MEEDLDVLEEVTVSDLDVSVDSVTISFWHVDAGEMVEQGDDLVDISFKKKSMTIHAPCSGMLHEIFFDEGDEASIDDVIANIDSEI